MDAEAANAPRKLGREAGYEAWYVTFADPASGLAAWLRWTVVIPTPGSPVKPAAGLWATVFERGRGAVATVRREHPPDALAVSRPFTAELAGSRLDDSGSEGSVATADGVVEWELNFDSLDRAYTFLSPAMERFSANGNASPHPALVVDGTLAVNGVTHRVSGVMGGQGHTWGSRHAVSWNWAHASWSDGSWLTGATAHTGSRLGAEMRATMVGLRSPAIGVRDGGVRLQTPSPLALIRPGRVQPLEWDAERRFGARDVHVRVVADPADIAVLEYTDPDGGRRLCHHSEFARLTATVRVAGETEAVLEHRATAFEFGETTAAN